MTRIVDADCVIIGAGAVGLSIGRALALQASRSSTVVIIDRHSKFGQEISSRNSEVIHAGIYYKQGSLKALHCIRGKELTYDYAVKSGVPFDKCGKLILSFSDFENDKLDEIYNVAVSLSVPIERIAKERVFKMSGIEGSNSALWSPSTGILDSHAFMQSLLADFENSGGVFSKNTELVGVEERNRKLILCCREPDGDFFIRTSLVVNSAGLCAAKVMAFFDSQTRYRVKPCRGRYFVLKDKFRNRFASLVYPIPRGDGGLGIHITRDMSGQIRLGPDVDWSAADTVEPDSQSLLVFPRDPGLKEQFFQSGQKFIKELNLDDIYEGYIGVRPKLFIGDNLVNDFRIETLKVGSAHVINLLGIESPGLTAAMSLAENIAKEYTF